MKLEKINFKLLTTISVVCTTVMVVFSHASPSLGYNADDFHLWQIITAHFIHYDTKHLITNMLALSLLIYLFPATYKSHLIAMVLAIILIDIYLYFSGIKYYAGYSGLLYVIPGMACMRYVRLEKYSQALMIIVFLMFYLLLLANDNNLSNNLQWQPLKQAHLSGFIGGFLSQLKVLNSQLGRLRISIRQ